MPVQLDTFRSIAETQRHQQVLLQTQGAATAEGIKTRGSFVSWVVNLFRGDGVRSDQSAVAQAFVQALQNHVQQGNEESQQLTGALKSDYSVAMHEAMNAVRGQLANQLQGTSALTTDDIETALSFIARVQQDTLTPLMKESREAATLETASQRLQAARLVRTRFDEVGTTQKSPGQYLAHYISGQKPTAEDVAAAQVQLEALKETFAAVDRSVRELKQLAATAEKPEIVQAMREALEQVKLEKAPVDALDWFNEGHRFQGLASARTDTQSVHLGNGDDLENARTPRQLLQAFRSGEKLGQPDLQYLEAWANRFPGLSSPTKWLSEMSNGEKGMRVMQNSLSIIPEVIYSRMAGGGIALDAQLLDGQGGVTATPYGDQAVLVLWDRRDEMVATLQDVALLQEQARAAVAAAGDFTQGLPDHVDPFRQAPAPGDSPQHEPNPTAEPGRSTLSSRQARIMAVAPETVEYHAPKPGESDDTPASYGLNPAQRLSRADRVKALNTQLGLSEDGKTRLTSTGAAGRHAQQAVTVDPQAEPGRSIPQAGKGAVKGFDHEVGSGRDEAARPATPRTSIV